MENDWYLARQQMNQADGEAFDRLMTFDKEHLAADCLHLMDHQRSAVSRIRHAWSVLDDSVRMTDNGVPGVEVLIWLRREIGLALNGLGTYKCQD